MKITVILLFAACFQVSANGFAQKVTLSERKASLEKIFRKINVQSGYLFFYDLDLLKKARPIDIHVKDADVDDVLAICFKDQPLEYTISNKIIIVKPREIIRLPNTIEMPPPPMDISGSIKDENGKPLADASIKLKGTSRGTTADANGNFNLQVPDGGGTLIISFIGFQTREIPVTKSGAVSIVLKLDDAKIDVAVVIGYGTAKKTDLTGSLSTVSSKDFENAPVTRLDQALQGRATGVQVTSSSGSPGGDVRIRIRGSNSLTGDNSPLYVVDGFVGADFNNINAEDIANVVVLKDASSTAIYGSRGANGVIIITTKTGKKGGMQTDFMTRFSTSTRIKKFDIMNAADFATTVNDRAKELAAGGPWVPRFTQAQIDAFKQNGGTDWQDVIFRNGGGQEYQLGFSGGSDKTSFRINANYLGQDGVIKNSDYKRYSLRTNLASQISDKFSIRFNFAGIRRENHNTDGTGARGAALGQAVAWAPTTPVYDANGRYTIKDPTSSIFQNPLALAEQTDNRDERTNLNALGGLKYKFTPELSLDVQFGIDYTNNQHKGFFGSVITGDNPSANRSSGENILLQNTNNLTYKKIFKEAHSLEVTGVFETQKFIGTGFNVSVNNLVYPNQEYNLMSLASNPQTGSGYSQWSLLSLLGRVNYAYKDKYLVSGSLRRDGSSKFRGNNKYSLFPSAALAWKLSEETFMKDVATINNLKLRGSWGLTGNQGINPYGTLTSFTTNPDDASAVFNGNGGALIPGMALGNPGNADLKWETTEQINIGTDIEIWRGAVSFSADYFIKKTRNLLLNQPVPGYLGGNSILSNIGNMENKGWEFSLTTNAFRHKEVNWTSSVTVSFIKNTLTSLGKGATSLQFNEFILKPGSPIGTLYGYQFLGTYKPKDAAEAASKHLKPGDARYVDVNNDGSFNEKDWGIIGHALPTTSLGWNNTITYKAFTLNVFFQGLLGMDKLNYSYAFGMLGSTDAKEVLFNDIKGRYIPGVNETSDIPAFSGANSNSFNQSSRFIEKADFVRLKNISLSYQLKKSVLKNIASMSVFANATNLLTFTKYKGIDPESNSNQAEGVTWRGYSSDAMQGVDQGAYPNVKAYTVGVKLTF